MSRKPHSTSLILLLVCIFAFWWGISIFSSYSVSTKSATAAAPGPAASIAPRAEPIVVYETNNAGVYTFSGSYTLPSSCDSLGSGIRYDSGGVSVLLSMEPPATVCTAAAGALAEPFSVSIKLPKGAPPVFAGVFLNGSAIPASVSQSN